MDVNGPLSGIEGFAKTARVWQGAEVLDEDGLLDITAWRTRWVSTPAKIDVERVDVRGREGHRRAVRTGVLRAHQQPAFRRSTALLGTGRARGGAFVSDSGGHATSVVKGEQDGRYARAAGDQGKPKTAGDRDLAGNAPVTRQP